MFDTLVKIAKNKEADPDLLIELVQHIRPQNTKLVTKAVERFSDLLFVLEKDEYLLSGFRVYMKKLFRGREFSSLIADLGIVSEGSFVREIGKRLYNKFLPVQPSENGMEYVLSNVFYHRKDYKWVDAIDAKNWEKFFDMLEIKPLSEQENDSFVVNQVLFSIELLALRISGTAMDYSLLRMAPEYAGLDSPFIALQSEVSAMTLVFRNKKNERITEDLNVKQVRVLTKQCKEYLDRVSRNKEKFGISYLTTLKLVRLQQQLDRLEMLLAFLVEEPDGKFRHSKTYRFLNQIIRLNASKNNIRTFFRTATGLVAYQITQHSGKTGEHYITSTRKEYNKMFLSAAGGGVIVGFLCLLKARFSYVDTSPFGHAFLYSMNYAAGFITIYLLHFTLATKQPAMTAATFAQAVKGKGKDGYEKFSELFVRLFRSQFIAFTGNVFLAFPVAILLVVLWQWLFDSVAITPEKGTHLLREINFFKTKSLLHAAIAGVYLFLSGLISGYYINRNIHDGISLRIKKHPFLRRFFSKQSLEKLAKLYDKHIGGLSGNFWFGVFLGTTGTIGLFFGLDIDIRHITFAAGNFGLALMGLNFDVSVWDVIVSILGIGLIGFFNFIVSFSLSLGVAIRSRNMHFYEFFPIAGAIWQRFRSNKRDFFFPPPSQVLAITEIPESIDTDNKK